LYIVLKSCPDILIICVSDFLIYIRLEGVELYMPSFCPSQHGKPRASASTCRVFFNFMACRCQVLSPLSSLATYTCCLVGCKYVMAWYDTPLPQYSIFNWIVANLTWRLFSGDVAAKNGVPYYHSLQPKSYWIRHYSHWH